MSIADNFTVEHIDWANARDRDACRKVRETVFVVEQNVPVEDEPDEFDIVSHHVLARDLGGEPIATGRLVPPAGTAPARLGRMAVLKNWRGQHVGEAMLVALSDRARELGFLHIEMHAQSHAVPFYERFGFEPFGDEFFECAIAHRNMRKALQPMTPVDRPPPAPASLPHPIESLDEAVAATLAVIRATRRELCLYTRDLDPELLDSEAVIEAIKSLAIGGRGARVRVLVQTPQVVAQDGHRLVSLGQRLTSVIEFRTPVDDDLQYAGAFVVNDVFGYFFRALGARFDGETAARSPGRGGQLQHYFDTVWERASLCEDLRQLNL